MRDLSLRGIECDPVAPLRIQSRRKPGGRVCSQADRFGVVASILCAVHCAVTPLILLMAPAFGGVWAHPASHWGAALLVVPLASTAMVHGYRKHGKKWVVACGSTGILFLLIGAVLPYLDISTFPLFTMPEAGDVTFVYDVETASTVGECQDSCCPSIVQNGDGTSRLHVPPASIVTTLGGIALIMTHLGNLCSCRGCRK
ncbi:MerC domain-containing protein [Verrucomicrobiales bacterium BCK34]|nr:MerC domain-containing protein [Verrucomicrobiales bacterium BCK34]